MVFEDIIESPHFWILTAVGEIAILIMLVVLKVMKQQSIMPLWVKILVILLVPVIAGLWTNFAEG